MFSQVLVLKPAAFANVDIRVRVSGGGHASQVYAIRQAIGKAIVAYTAKYEDAAQALDLKKALVAYDRTLLVADPRRCEPKKFGGPGQSIHEAAFHEAALAAECPLMRVALFHTDRVIALHNSTPFQTYNETNTIRIQHYNLLYIIVMFFSS